MEKWAVTQVGTETLAQVGFQIVVLIGVMLDFLPEKVKYLS